MYTFEILKVPNQRFSTTIGDNKIVISLRTFRDLLYASISINDETVECGDRCMPNASVFSMSVNRMIGGAFAFICDSDDYPNYGSFNDSCKLAFVEA